MSLEDTILSFEQAQGTCAICISEIDPLDEVRTIRTCQHSFHSQCLEEWLTRKAECPLCRGELPSYAASARQNASYEQIEEVVALLQREMTLIQSSLTYGVVCSLLDRFPVSHGRGGLLEAVPQIRTALEGVVVNGVRPLPVALESRYALQAQARGLRSALAEQLGCRSANVHRNDRVKRIRALIRLPIPLAPSRAVL